MAKQKMVVHTVDGKHVSHQAYWQNWGADQIIAERFIHDRLDPFQRHGYLIASVQEDEDGYRTVTYKT